MRATHFLCIVFILFIATTKSLAYPVIQAESYNSMSGIQLENSGTTVGYFDAGDWLKYDNIDFGNAPGSIIFNVAKNGSGGSIELHLDNPNGRLIATFKPESTNSWTAFQDQMCNIDTVTGIHSLYLMALGANGVCNIDFFTLSDSRIYEPNWVLVWSDEFNGNAVDETVWRKVYHGNPDNGELQFYTPRPENIVVSDGTLKLIARKEKFTGQGPWMSQPATRDYTSGKVETQGKKTFKYGKFEASMKLPRGKGTWPAFWLLGENLFDAGVGWPKCGEIDIMEHGQDFNNLGAAIHTATYNHTIGTQKTGTYQINNYDTGFHIYGMEWSASQLKFSVDGNVYFTVTKAALGSTVNEWPFDQPFWIILNHAVGGAWGGTPDTTLYPHTVEVDWVRVYQDMPTMIKTIQLQESNIIVSPNPATDMLTIESTNQPISADHNSHLILRDIVGNIVVKKDFLSVKEILNLKTLPNGMYFLSVEQCGQILKSVKIIKN